MGSLGRFGAVICWSILIFFLLTIAVDVKGELLGGDATLALMLYLVGATAYVLFGGKRD